jgi:hypothetical protein
VEHISWGRLCELGHLGQQPSRECVRSMNQNIGPAPVACKMPRVDHRADSGQDTPEDAQRHESNYRRLRWSGKLFSLGAWVGVVALLSSAILVLTYPFLRIPQAYWLLCFVLSVVGLCGLVAGDLAVSWNSNGYGFSGFSRLVSLYWLLVFRRGTRRSKGLRRSDSLRRAGCVCCRYLSAIGSFLLASHLPG